ARKREDFTSLLGGKPRRDQRPGIERRLDDEDTPRETAHQAIPPREILLERRGAGGELRDHEAPGGELRRALPIARRIDAIGARPDHRDAAPRMSQPAAVSRGVDAERETAHDRKARGGERGSERLGVFATLRGRVTATDDRKAGHREQLAPSLQVED